MDGSRLQAAKGLSSPGRPNKIIIIIILIITVDVVNMSTRLLQ